MLYLIAYDITAPRRLRRIATLCEDYGVRVQKSLFECNLSRERFSKLWKELLETYNEKEDSLVAYPLCKTCQKEMETAGSDIERISFDEPLIF